jgi:hypothetical protein
MPSGSKKKEPRYACLNAVEAEKLTENVLSFPPLLHTSYVRDYWLAPLSEDVF